MFRRITGFKGKRFPSKLNSEVRIQNRVTVSRPRKVQIGSFAEVAARRRDVRSSRSPDVVSADGDVS